MATLPPTHAALAANPIVLILVPKFRQLKGGRGVLFGFYAKHTVFLQYPKIWVFFQFFGQIDVKTSFADEFTIIIL